MPKDDAIIARIRETRHTISEEQSHEPKKVVAYYIELQKRYRERLMESARFDDQPAQPKSCESNSHEDHK